METCMAANSSSQVSNTSMRLSVVIVNYNGGEVLPECLSSLKESGCGNDCEVLVVDNASSDNSIGSLRDLFPWVTVIENRENLGFARGCNVGIRASRGRMILFLNPDTRFRNDALALFTDFLERNPSIGLIGPRMVYPDGGFQLSCGSLPTAFREITDKLLYASVEIGLPGVRFLLDRTYRRVRPVGWLTGACLLGRREALEEVDGFDERIFMYFEDKDLCKRVAEAGWGVVHYPGAVVSHMLGKSSRTSDADRLRGIYRTSQRYYYEKHLGTIDRALLKVYLALRSAIGFG